MTTAEYLSALAPDLDRRRRQAQWAFIDWKDAVLIVPLSDCDSEGMVTMLDNAELLGVPVQVADVDEPMVALRLKAKGKA